MHAMPMPRSGALPARTLACALAALLVLALGSFVVGPYPVSPLQVLRALGFQLGLLDDGGPELVRRVVLEVRGPRIGAALLVGAALAAAGATYQNLFRNPMVSPGVLGVSAGAGLGAALGLLLDATGLGVQGLAFGGGLLAVAMALVLGRAFHATGSLLTLVVAGLVVSAFFQALVSLAKVVADPLNQLPGITFWLLGGLHRIDAAALGTALLPIGASGAVLWALRWQVHALAAGDDEARTLGVDVPRLRVVLILCATLMTAACVSISGIVGWVGLLIPHIVRMLAGPAFAAVLPLSALLGGGFLLAVDDLARGAGGEIPLGILTALIGAPLFALVLARSRQAWF
jgi:iron complex transport system permease protein